MKFVHDSDLLALIMAYFDAELDRWWDALDPDECKAAQKILFTEENWKDEPGTPLENEMYDYICLVNRMEPMSRSLRAGVGPGVTRSSMVYKHFQNCEKRKQLLFRIYRMLQEYQIQETSPEWLL